MSASTPPDTAICIQVLFDCRANPTLVGNFATHASTALPTHTDEGSGRGGFPPNTAVCIQALFDCRANLTLVGHFATHDFTALPTHTEEGSGGGGGSEGGASPPPDAASCIQALFVQRALTTARGGGVLERRGGYLLRAFVYCYGCRCSSLATAVGLCCRSWATWYVLTRSISILCELGYGKKSPPKKDSFSKKPQISNRHYTKNTAVPVTLGL